MMQLGFIAAALVAALGVGCSDDASTTSGSSEGGGGAGAGGGSGRGGATVSANPDAGASGAPEAGSPPTWPSAEPPATSVVCAGAVCEGAGGLTPCCTQSDACGAQYLGRAGAGCVVVNDPGLIDPACPETPEGSGCCRADGFCGAFYSPTFGCVDPNALPTSNPPVPIPCTRTP